MLKKLLGRWETNIEIKCMIDAGNAHVSGVFWALCQELGLNTIEFQEA